MAFLVKALCSLNECSKNADISILMNFLAIFSNFFQYREISKSLKSIEPFKQKLQRETGSAPPAPWPYQSAKSTACLGLIIMIFCC